MAVLKLCQNCHAQTYGKYQGSSVITVLLLCVGIIPGLIYSQWRGSKGRNICVNCGNTGLIPIDSPLAIQLRSQFRGATSSAEATASASPSYSPTKPTKAGEINPSVGKLIIVAAIGIGFWYLNGKLHPPEDNVITSPATVSASTDQDATVVQKAPDPGLVPEKLPDPQSQPVDNRNPASVRFAQQACAANLENGIAKGCHVEGRNIAMSISRPDNQAHKVCKQLTEVMREAGMVFEPGWHIIIKTTVNLPNGRRLATCSM